MQFTTLLSLLLSTPSFANIIIGRQGLVLECGDGEAIAPVNTATSISCAARPTSILSGSLTSQSFPRSNSTAISYDPALGTSRLSLSSSAGVPTSTQKSSLGTGSGVWSSTVESGSSQTNDLKAASSISSSTSRRSVQPTSSTSSDGFLTIITPSLEPTRSGDSSTYSSPQNIYHYASTPPVNPSGSSSSISSLGSRPSDPENVNPSTTALSSTDSQSATSPKNTPSQSTGSVAPNGAITQISTSTSVTTPVSITGISRFTGTTSLGDWPATITFCSESSGHPVVGYGFLTTNSGGSSSVTNTIPRQTLICTSTSLACAGEVAVFDNGLTTIIELSTLPSATPYPQSATAADVQVLTQSSTPNVYDIKTLLGYENSQPVLISTDFVEVINGHTTSQKGWWLIGYHGRIVVPKTGPWRTTGDRWGCIGGPALCDVPCGHVDIGLGLFVHLPLAGCSDRTGPPGWPGGPIISGLLPPFPEEKPGEEPGHEGGHEPDETTITTTSDEQSTTTSSIQSSVSKARYFIIASHGAVQSKIQAELKVYDPAKGGTYQPDVSNMSVSGGTWIDYQLDASQSAIIASRTDIILVMERSSVSWFDTGTGPTTDFANVPSVVFDTINAEPTTTSLGLGGSKNRRNHPNAVQDNKTVIVPVPTRGFHKANTTMSPGAGNARVKHFRHEGSIVAAIALQERDTGTRLVRQVRPNLMASKKDPQENFYPNDLAVMSWAPGVPSIAAGKVDYIFEETKGEGTWAYLVDTGVEMGNSEFTDSPKFRPSGPRSRGRIDTD